MNKKVLSLDFDGVCNLYTSGWQGADIISDDAVPGLFEFLEKATEQFDVQIYSSRTNIEGGKEAMENWFIQQRKKWLDAGGQGRENLDISFPTKKPAAFIGLDDRVLTFDGTFPDIDTMINFRPWNKK